MKRAMSGAEARGAGVTYDVPAAPEGVWRGRLVAKAWGKSANLLCVFENVDTGVTYRCTAFRGRRNRRIYCANDEGVDFSEAGIEGTVYLLTTGTNSKGNALWKAAVRLLDE